MTETALPEIVKGLVVKPGDHLLVTCPEGTTREHVTGMAAGLRDRFPEVEFTFLAGAEVILLDQPAAAGPVADERPHSRACGIRPHEHGTWCSTDCPTCHGVATLADKVTFPRSAVEGQVEPRARDTIARALEPCGKPEKHTGHPWDKAVGQGETVDTWCTGDPKGHTSSGVRR